MNYLDMNLWQVKELLDKGEVTSEQLTSMCFEQIEKTKEINALLSLCKESALKTAKEIDEKRKKGGFSNKIYLVEVEQDKADEREEQEMKKEWRKNGLDER